MSNASGDDPIRDAVLTVPEDLLSLRAVLDRGHNITRSDGYALLNYIERASGDDKELTQALDDLQSSVLAWAGCNPYATSSPNDEVMIYRRAIASLFGRIREERDALREKN